MVAFENIPKARWDDTNTELLVKICVEEVQAGNRPHTHFTKEGWKYLVSKFVVRTWLSYNHKQLKNKWDSLKKEFSLWAKLVEHQTGLGWDSTKRIVLANDEWWEKKDKNEGPKILDLMEICFKDVVATGYMALVPYADPSTDNEVSNQNVYTQMNEVEVEADNFDDDGDSPKPYNDTPRGETSTGQDKKRRKMSRRERKKKCKRKIIGIF
ncbi:hypothetical protein J5N97_013182 [Dioscorea zingiberensis]|uniref:Myb/SANT-like domain-containing protein n=1 Tax=Dioscorea zingiberensis TaxID=325984 RepID=A0A9D5CSX6_9LILI|nr:hypothetical protein J5N97_013182 [Dioscorea zingiberensis]